MRDLSRVELLPHETALLGTMPDAKLAEVVARRTKRCSPDVIQKRRTKAGIPRYRDPGKLLLMKVLEDEAVEKLLGTMPDKAFAEKFSTSRAKIRESQVRYQRAKMGIDPFDANRARQRDVNQDASSSGCAHDSEAQRISKLMLAWR